MSETVELAVVFFKLVEGNFDHWALWLHGPSYNKLFQVTGDYAEMRAQMLDEDPTDNTRLYQTITLDDILIDRIQAVEACIYGVRVQNDVALWDCQDYVLDVLDTLEDNGFLGGHAGYLRTRKALTRLRGPADETRHLVEQYDPDHPHIYATQSTPLCEESSSSEPGEESPKRICSAEIVYDSDDES